MAKTTKTEFGERVSTKVRLEMLARDKRVKVWLLVVSVLTIIALGTAAVQENYMADWRVHQLEYAGILDEKATDDLGEKLAENFEVEMRQIVLPGLDTIDRCISCHTGIEDPRMTDVEQPYSVHPGDYLDQHDVNTFGCTICHRGQGRAMEFEEAKAVGYHWDYPLLPAGLTQSSCGVCHSADEVANTGGELYAEGKQMFETKGCSSCHKVKGRGGSLGPELDKVGMKVRMEVPMKSIEGVHTLPQWLMEHFENPQKIVEESQMKPPGLSDDEILALTTYMLSLQGRDLPSTYLSPEKHLEAYKAGAPLGLSGEEMFKKFCASCHDSGEVGGYDKFFKQYMPAVRGPTYSQIATVEYLEKNIKGGHTSTLMPSWNENSGGLSDEEVRSIAEFLLSGDKGAHTLPASAIARAQDSIWMTPGDVMRGTEIFTKQCVGCHGSDAAGLLGPSLNNKVFQDAATDGFIFTTIAQGRRNSAMPGFLGDGGLSEEQIEDLVAFVRSLVKEKGTDEERP